MTREEIEELKGLAASMGLYDDKNPCKRAVVLGKAINALDQEPCDDCISRKEVIKLMEWGWKKGIFPIYQIIALPSVTPAENEKVGQWVFVKGYEGILYECTVCKNKNTHTTVRWNYCPNCGAKMQEVKA